MKGDNAGGGSDYLGKVASQKPGERNVPNPALWPIFCPHYPFFCPCFCKVSLDSLVCILSFFRGKKWDNGINGIFKDYLEETQVIYKLSKLLKIIV